MDNSKYMTRREFETLCCWCGRLKNNKGECSTHGTKPKPEERKKIGKYSGDSKWRQEQGQFQAKWGG